MGTVLDFHIGFCYVLSHDAKAEKLQAADENNHADSGGPSVDRIIKDQLTQYDNDQGQEGNTSHAGSKPGSNGQWSLGEINDSADGIFKQLPEIPFGLAGNTFDIFVREPEGFETDPSEDSLGKTVIFAHGDDGIYHTALHQTEISGTVHDIRIRDLVNKLIEFPGKKTSNGWFAIAADTPGGNAVIFSGFQFLQHFRKERWRILQVSVHDRNVITTGIAEACIHGCFLSEVSGKRKIDHMRIFF